MFQNSCVLLVALTAFSKMVAMSSTQIDDHFNTTNLDEFEPAEETQHTYCKIATEELQATANATITRELRGVCTSKELKRSISAILREIQALKDALQQQGGRHNSAMRNKRKNLLNLFAVSNKDAVNHEQFRISTNMNTEGRYSYYWTLSDVEQYLYEGVSLKSPIITFQENKYYLRLSIADRVATVHLINKDHLHDVSYTIFVLAQTGVKDLRLDASNDYSATLRRLRQFKHDNTIFIKLVIE